MGIRVTTQAQGAEIRRRLRTCYLCGGGLDTGAEITREHVIPKGVLGPPPDDSAWPILLDVHRTCEVTTKRTQDSWLKLYERFTADPRRLLEEVQPLMHQLMDSEAYLNSTATEAGATLQREWIESLCGPLDGIYESWARHLRALDFTAEPDGELAKVRDKCLRLLERIYACPERQLSRGHYRAAPLTVGVPVPPGREAPTPSLGVTRDFIRGVWTWARGLHAFLYETYLPADVPHFCAAPVPMFGSRPEHSIEAVATTTGAIQGTLFTADALEAWDGVSAWGQRVSYQCTWATCPEQPTVAKCCWRLSLPVEWIEARASLFPGTSWTGWYELPAVPHGAATTTTDAMTIGRLNLQL